jgi:hypothetical protein
MIAPVRAGCWAAAHWRSPSRAPPRIEQQGDAYRVVAKGKPMLMLGGELGNFSASSESYMAPHGRG